MGTCHLCEQRPPFMSGVTDVWESLSCFRSRSFQPVPSRIPRRDLQHTGFGNHFHPRRVFGSGGTGGWGRAGGAQHQAVLHCICGLSRLRQQHSQGPRAGVLEKQGLCWNSVSRFFISLGEVECTLWGAGALGSNDLWRSPGSSLLGLRLLFCRMGVIIIASNSLDCSVLKRQYEEEF